MQGKMDEVHLERALSSQPSPSPISPPSVLVPSLRFPSLLLLPLLPFSFFSLLCLLLLSVSLGRQYRDSQDLKAEQGEMDRDALEESSAGLGCVAYFILIVLTIFHLMSFQPLRPLLLLDQ